MPGSRSRWRTMTAGASVCPAANQCGASRRSSVRMVVTGDAAREDAVPAVGGTLVAANVVVGEAQGRRTDAERGSSVKGKEPAEADAGLDSGGEGEATSTGAGADGGRGKGKGRADNGSAKACRGRSSMDCSGGGRLGEGSGRWVARAAGVQEMGLAGRAAVSGRRLTKTSARQRSTCKECGGASICQHLRIRRRCKTCKADMDESMPPDLKELQRSSVGMANTCWCHVSLARKV